MYLDKRSVIGLIDETSEDFEAISVSINTLPDDTLFEIVVEEGATAECINKDGELVIFPIKFTITKASEGNTIIVEQAELNRTINSMLKEEKEQGESIDSLWYLKYIMLGVIIATLITIYFAMEFIKSLA